jgi:hypothetical protein
MSYTSLIFFKIKKKIIDCSKWLYMIIFCIYKIIEIA